MYYNPTLERNDLIERLKELDDYLFRTMQLEEMKTIRLKITIAGSSSLILNKVNIRKLKILIS